MKTYFSIGSISIEQLVQMCDGTLLQYNNDTDSAMVKSICTDSREADKDSVFCAIKGERVDGHDFVNAAQAGGCRAFLCERVPQNVGFENCSFIVVPNVEKAILTLASGYCQGLSAKTVAVTGSVGKTTTKDMIAAVLNTKYNAFKTKGNFNSVIGMPLSMLEIPQNCEYSVLEMGMSGFGEVESLSNAAQPDFAVITTIGTSHLEMLGSRENICRAKLEILCGLKKGGVLLLNGDEPLLANVYGKSYKTVYISTERENADFFAKNIKVEADGTRFDIVYNGVTYTDLAVRVVGRHNVYSALFAFAIGMLSGETEEEIRAGLLCFSPEHLRQNIYKRNGYVIMEDCYNASPESMQAALDVLISYRRFSSGKTIAILGDMLELGEESSALHRQVGAHLAKRGIDRLITLGKGGGYIAVGAKQCGMKSDRICEFSSYEERLDEIASSIREVSAPGDVLLFKASRGVRIERLIECFEKQLR